MCIIFSSDMHLPYSITPSTDRANLHLPLKRLKSSLTIFPTTWVDAPNYLPRMPASNLPPPTTDLGIQHPNPRICTSVLPDSFAAPSTDFE